uniref:Tyrosine--tRNA ligase n=2 Tax=Macrostomum lignano TaxID=282301 RepID=A0A1I8IQM2_9PLAT
YFQRPIINLPGRLCRRCLSAGGGSAAESVRALLDRGCFQAVLPLKSEKYFNEYLNSASGGRYFYCGFDPTANSLHLGNLLAIVGLLRLRSLGHGAIFVVGGATARIGDPSGRMSDRVRLAERDVEENSASIGRQLAGIADNHGKYFCCDGARPGEAVVLNNQSWHANLSATEFLSGQLSGARLHDLLGKHSVQTRLNSKHGMSVKEFLYPLFQAYDWLHLYKTYGCLVQIGGNDQTGNIDTGLTCLRRFEQSGVLAFGLTVPLLTTSDGQKLGKSDQLADTVWLSSERTSPFALYQRLRNTPDADVGRLLRLFTFLSDRQVAELCERHAAAPERYEAQTTLADGVTLLLHGEAGLAAARKWTSILFGEDSAALASLTPADLAAGVLSESPSRGGDRLSSCRRRLAWRDGVSLRQLLLSLLAEDGGNGSLGQMTPDQVNQALSAGRVTLNLRRHTSAAESKAALDAPLSRDSCVLPGCGASLIKLSKRRFLLIEWDNL